jgi:hypothetical protein
VRFIFVLSCIFATVGHMAHAQEPPQAPWRLEPPSTIPISVPADIRHAVFFDLEYDEAEPIAVTASLLALGPTGIVIAFVPVLIRGLAIVPGTAAECPRVIAISVTTARSEWAPVVVAIAVA